MRNAYSYEGILSAVGRVLDEAGVKRIAIQDVGDGLLVEGFDAAGQEVTLRYDVPALFGLIDPDANDGAHEHRHAAHDDGTLRQFLEQRELVGAR